MRAAGGEAQGGVRPGRVGRGRGAGRPGLGAGRPGLAAG